MNPRPLRLIVLGATAAGLCLSVLPSAARDLRPPARPNDPPPSYFDLGPPPAYQPPNPPNYVQQSLDYGPQALDGTMGLGDMDDDMPSSFGIDPD